MALAHTCQADAGPTSGVLTMTLYRATVETASFLFDAYGTTPEDAELTLRQTLDLHEAEYGLTEEWYYDDDIVVRECTAGIGYRDDEPLWKDA